MRHLRQTGLVYRVCSAAYTSQRNAMLVLRSLGIMILVLLLNAVTLAIEYFSGVSPRGVPHQVVFHIGS